MFILVYCVFGGTTATLQLDTELPGGMGRPAIVQDRTLVPLAYVSQVLGVQVTHRLCISCCLTQVRAQTPQQKGQAPNITYHY